MPTITEMMDNVALRLGDSRANRPGYAQALNTVCTKAKREREAQAAQQGE